MRGTNFGLVAMSRRKKIWLAVLAVMAVLIGYGVYRYREFSRDMNAEYGTAQTIGKVGEYIEAHDGRWPTNWDEIEPWPGVRELVVVKFDVDVDRLIEDPEAIQSTIVPITGPYDVYPHARADLRWLREQLIRFHHRKPTASGTTQGTAR